MTPRPKNASFAMMPPQKIADRVPMH
jgi:hypothetical protein